MKLGFATDIHLDVVVDRAGYLKRPEEAQALLKRVGVHVARDVDALVIGGDISTGSRFRDDFQAFCKGAAVPVYFVLGNHDFWDAPEATVRTTAAEFPGYLDHVGVVPLNPLTALVGRSGWYDTLTGNPFESQIHPNDWERAERLSGCWRYQYLLQKECRAWSLEETTKVVPVLEAAAVTYPNVYFVTHFPCFVQACWDEFGKPDVEKNGWWPWSINTTLGRAVLDVVEKHRGVQFTMLTGHTHGPGKAQVRSNLTCISGRAHYGNPQRAASWLV